MDISTSDTLFNKGVVYEINVTDSNCQFATSITEALEESDKEIQAIQETLDTVNNIKPHCDKTDYALAASIGALSGVVDVFLVGKPGESPMGVITDKWFSDRTKDFAKLCGWKDDGSNSLNSAVSYLERKFKVPYDQNGIRGEAAFSVFDLNPSNHHFKSLPHNPTLLGLFYSILDQFCNTSHFVVDGQLISLVNSDNGFELRGSDFTSKLVCGVVNWFGHLVSDVSGSAESKGRGMGIPSPFWAWTNDVIAIKRQLSIPVTDFDKNINELALKIYEKGFDIRFQSTQLIPVFINEILVRLFYSIRRLVRYFANTEKDQITFNSVWDSCEPFSNPTVKRMLTVAHGSFCVVDLGDAVIRGFISGAGSFNPAEFAMRINIAGIGRFAISLYGEANQAIAIYKAEKDAELALREETILLEYIEGLKTLSRLYDDKYLMTFVDDLTDSNLYKSAFEKTVALAELRGVPEDNILHSKEDIDSYFTGADKNEKS